MILAHDHPVLEQLQALKNMEMQACRLGLSAGAKYVRYIVPSPIILAGRVLSCFIYDIEIYCMMLYVNILKRVRERDLYTNIFNTPRTRPT